MTVAGRLVSVLAAASSLPVLPPGSPGGVLPCLIVTPGDDEVGDGGLFLVHRYDVSVCVPRDDTTTQLDRLETLTTETYQILRDAGYAGDDRIRYDGGDYESVQYLRRIIRVEDAGERLC